MNKALLATLAAAAALPVPASAQGSANAESVYDFGRCVVKDDRDAAARLLSQLPYEGEVDNVRTLLGGGAAKCQASAPAAVSAQQLRGALAQELFKKDFKEFGMTPETPVYRLAEVSLPIADNAPVSPQTRNLYKLAECTVRNDGSRVEYLLATPLGSSREQTQFDNLAPVLLACQPAGTQLNMSRLTMRSAIALAAYDVAARFATGKLVVRRP